MSLGVGRLDGYTVFIIYRDCFVATNAPRNDIRRLICANSARSMGKGRSGT